MNRITAKATLPSDMGRRWVVVVVALSVCLVAIEGFGAPLGLQQRFPDINATFITLNYTASGSTGTLNATGQPISVKYSNDAIDSDAITGVGLTDYELNVQLDSSTGAPISGNISISGAVADQSIPYGTLLSSNTLTAFGFPDPPRLDPTVPAVFEFAFENLTGSLAPQWGDRVEVILNTGTLLNPGFDGFWDTDFQNNAFQGSADNFAGVPEPTFVYFWLTAAVAVSSVVVYRRRRSARATSAAEGVSEPSENQPV